MQRPFATGSDIWSTAAMTFLLLTGVSPFRGQGDADTITNVTYVRFPSHELYNGVTHEAIRFVLECLKLDPRLVTLFYMEL